ncbi:hypothetical protein CLV25_11345 [Acetobacteroides hydrogenigenes]|uniref:Uncharacterized protein n=1 Tax=Acetobacteroides hydrogenigenes TaxID=979970 RepID=A0A4V2RNP5_9BACT|nr:hypothetical protein CLV25_11345 [Acetobacteroides hydrogenigenes]
MNDWLIFANNWSDFANNWLPNGVLSPLFIP